MARLASNLGTFIRFFLPLPAQQQDCRGGRAGYEHGESRRTRDKVLWWLFGRGSVADDGFGAHEELTEVGVVRDARCHPVGGVLADVEVFDGGVGE